MLMRRLGRVDPFLIATAAFLAAYAVAFAAFLERFPRSYAWSELMIAYQGGYVRRGLLGHLAFLLDDVVGARPFLAGIVALGYVAVILFYVPAARRAGPWIGMLFVLSPATLLFPLLDPEAFGRKDALILTTFALSLAAARALGRGAALAATALAYATANLVVDSAIFYAPMAVFAGCWIGPARRGTGTATGTGTVLKASLAASALLLGLSELNLVLNAKFDEDNILGYQQLIARAWRARYPDAFQPNSAVEYIGMSVWEGIDLVLQTCRSTRPSCSTCSASCWPSCPSRRWPDGSGGTRSGHGSAPAACRPWPAGSCPSSSRRTGGATSTSSPCRASC